MTAKISVYSDELPDQYGVHCTVCSVIDLGLNYWTAKTVKQWHEMEHEAER